MMHNWFECKVRYEKTLENGMQKKVTEPYLVDALSFTEAEARIIKEITPFITGEFEVANVAKAKINEMFWDDSADLWFKCKVNFITLDEKSGMEKKTASIIMVQASGFAEALKSLVDGMKSTMADYEIAAINETQIMDVFPYNGDYEREEVEMLNYNGRSIEASVSSIEMLGLLLKAKKLVTLSRNNDPEGFAEVKSQILAQSQNKKSKYLSSAINLAKEASTDEHRIWFLGTAALMIEEYGAKKGGEDVTE